MFALEIEYNTLPFKYWYIGLNFIVIYVAIQVAMLLFRSGIKNSSETIGKINISLCFGFLFLTLNFIIKVISHYFYENAGLNQRILYLSAAFASSIVIGIIEPSILRYRIYTALSIINFVLFLVIDPFSPLITFAIVLSAFIAIFPILLFIFLLKNSGGLVRQRIWFLILSVLCLMIGIELNLEKFIPYITHLGFYLLSFLLIVMGLLGIYYSIRDVNVFIESGWRENLMELYIINRETLKPIYYQDLRENNSILHNYQELNFVDALEENDVNFFSGCLVGVDSLVKEISESDPSKNNGLSLIDLGGNKFLMIEHGDKIMVCFVTNKKLNSLRYFAREIRNAWQKYYSRTEFDSNGLENTYFNAMKVIVDRILHADGELKGTLFRSYLPSQKNSKKKKIS